MPLPRPLAECAAILRAQCAPALPVHIRLADLPGDRWADYTRCKRHHLIRLHRVASFNNPGLMCYLALHEWAHALANESDPREHDDHGPAFGEAYARCCRAYSLE